MASFWRNCAFAMQGYWYFTKNSSLGTPCIFDQHILRDTNGKSFMVTGANSGIGKEIASQLSKYPGATIHMICRNKQRGEDAMNEISQHCHPKTSLCLHILDLSRVKDVIEFTSDFIEKNKSLNVLINNAGALIENLSLTDEGLDSSFALNVVGTYILTEKLIPLLLKSSEDSGEKGRIVTVSSGGMLTEKLNFNDPEVKNVKYDGVKNYAQHKRQQVVLTEYWAKIYDGVHFSSMHPGWVDTPGVESSLPTFYQKMKSKLRTTAEGADSVVWLSMIKESLLPPSGSFVFDRQVAQTHVTLGGTSCTEEEVEKYVSNLKSKIATAVKMERTTNDSTV